MEKMYKETVIGAVKGDITKTEGMDAWVLGADTSLYLDSGVCKAIHRVAGSKLTEAVRKLGGCELGEAKITPAFDAPCKAIIHAAVPRWNGGAEQEEEQLYSCYTRICELAAEHGLKTVAMPSLGTGVYAWPMEKAIRTGLSAITGFIDRQEEKPDRLLWVLFDDATYSAYEEELNRFFG